MHNIEEKQGYKFTEEYGYIPEDWDIVPLTDFISTEKYAIVDGPFGSNLKTEHYRKKGIPIIQSGFVTSNKFTADSYLYVDEEKFQQEIRSKVVPGDIVMAKIGANCGTCAILPSKHPEGILAGNSLKITVGGENCNKFLMYLFHRLLPLNKMEEAISRTAQPALSCGRLKILPIIKPPLQEQEKIAEVLSDIDELIEATQKLIDKKKELKTATMQKLLTPKENWKKYPLGEILEYEQPTKYIVKNTEYNLYSVTPVLTAGKSFILGYTDETFAIFSNLPVIIFDDFTTDSKFVDFKFKVKSSAIKILKLRNTKFNIKLIFEIMQGIKFDASDHKRRWISEYQNIEILLPNDINEQSQITQTLSDMDSEIEALEKELNKYKDLKTGMMQELLTGKKRLLNNPNKVELFNAKKMSTPANKKVANDEFKDAIIISMLAYKFGSNQYPLGAFRRQKLSYLFKRHNNLPIDEYLKKAMGPYNPQMKYNGGEGIAIRNKYVKEVKQRGLIASSEIAKAKTYFDKYYSEDSLLWLEQNFRYKSNNELEVLATIDYTILDLKAQNKEITLVNIKEYINNNAEWKPKLEKPFFTDSAIIKAIQESKNLLNSH